jgi:beta-lactamase class D
MGRFLPMLILLLVAAPLPALDTTAALARVFSGQDATMVIFEPDGNRWTFHNETRARERFSPCSTFKIPNSVIALELGTVEDADTTFTWDGKVRSRPEENGDHTLRSAMRQSIVWYYQELARRAGEEHMAAYLKRFNYGNQDISGGLTKFWLGSTLKISAVEQIEFLRRVNGDWLPASERALTITVDIMRIETTPGFTLYGKTGSRGDGKGGYDLGWFVGWVERKGSAPVYFATNLSGPGAWGPMAREKSYEALRALEYIPPQSK